MKDLISKINKAFENRLRLGLMSLLMVNDSLDFNSAKEALQVTDGNLSSHASSLESEGYIRIQKMFEGKKPLTTYVATPTGRRAFKEHLDALEAILKANVNPNKKNK